MNGINALDTVGLTAMFVVVATLMLWVVIGSKGWWLLKMPVIMATVFFGLAVWYSVGSYLGWPSDHDPPRKFLIQGVIIKEPSKVDDDPGAIYLTLRQLPHPDDEKNEGNWFEVLGYEGNERAPRLYQLPYSRQLHKSMTEVQKMLQKGKKVIGEFQRGELGAKGEGDGKGKGKSKGKGGKDKGKKGEGGYGGDNIGLGDFIFYELPPPKFIPKNPQKH